MLVCSVGDDLVGCGQVAKRPEVGRRCGRKRVKRNVLAAVSPSEIPVDLQECFTGMHHFDDSAGLDSLPRIVVTGSAVLVAAEHSARHLTVHSPYRLIVSLRSCQMPQIPRLEVIGCRPAQGLRDIHVMPVRHAVCPVGCVAVNLGRQIQELLVPRTVVKPVYAGEIVPTTHVLPEWRKEIFLRDSQLPGEVSGHQTDNTLVAGILVVRLESAQHGHVRPQVRLAGAVSAWRTEIGPRPEPSVLPLACDDTVDPLAGLVDHFLIA